MPKGAQVGQSLFLWLMWVGASVGRFLYLRNLTWYRAARCVHSRLIERSVVQMWELCRAGGGGVGWEQWWVGQTVCAPTCYARSQAQSGGWGGGSWLVEVDLLSGGRGGGWPFWVVTGIRQCPEGGVALDESHWGGAGVMG